MQEAFLICTKTQNLGMVLLAKQVISLNWHIETSLYFLLTSDNFVKLELTLKIMTYTTNFFHLAILRKLSVLPIIMVGQLGQKQ